MNRHGASHVSTPFLDIQEAVPHPNNQSCPRGIHPSSEQYGLLGTPRRRQLLENIWQRASLSKQQFEEIYQRPLANYAELVQQPQLRKTITMPIQAG